MNILLMSSCHNKDIFSLPATERAKNHKRELFKREETSKRELSKKISMKRRCQESLQAETRVYNSGNRNKRATWYYEMIIHLSSTACSRGHWSLSQLPRGEGTVHPGQVSSSPNLEMPDWHNPRSMSLDGDDNCGWRCETMRR